MKTQNTLKTQQSGAVLIISLLILLVLTLIGISSMEGSLLEEKMAANSQTSTVTFQKAESAIQAAVAIARLDPPGAVKDAITNIAAVNRSANGITSASQLNSPINAKATPLLNSSAGLFVARRMEIIGTANVGTISSRNVQGYRVFPLMP